MQLSGNFGELRPNHFHAGVDFKTLQREVLEVHAAADGYVFKIKISTFGNGRHFILPILMDLLRCIVICKTLQYH
jgi:murein DD-endopeptidase MepM/ murein hydrolase activator NlpD